MKKIFALLFFAFCFCFTINFNEQINDEAQIFSKNGSILYKSKGNDITIYNKDGKPIHEIREGVLIFYNEDGDEIIMNSYKVEDIKKID